MSKEIYRRCSCRGEDGKQLGASCPKLKSNPRHGTWAYRASAGVDAQGKRRRVTKTGFQTREEAERALERVKRRLRRGSYNFERLTVSQHAEAWYKRGKATWARKTADGYRRYLDRDLLPEFGDMRLDELRRRHVIAWVDDQIEEGRGVTALNRAVACLRSMLSDAVKRDLIEVNPAAQVPMPKPAAGQKVKYWPAEVVDKFLRAEQAVDEHGRLVDPLAPLWTVALGTGMRRGELVGLRWEDVDLAARQLTVNVQLVEVDGVHEVPIKTPAGRGRVIPLVEPVIDALLTRRRQAAADRQSLEEVGLVWKDTGRVFGREDGAELRPEHVTKTFGQRVEKLGLPTLTLHGLRHTFAAVALGSGQTMGVVSKLMGHASVGITIDLYSHLATDRAREAMGGIDQVLQGACSAGITSGITDADPGMKEAPAELAEAPRSA